MGGQINFKITGKKVDKQLTAIYEVNDISYSTIKKKIISLKEYFDSNNADYICVVYGAGAQPKSIYKDLKKLNGIRVLWFRSMLKSFWRIFQYLIASYEGVIIIEKTDVLYNIFEILIHQSMASVYIIQKKNLNFFLEMLKISDIDLLNKLLAVDNQAVIYTVDADNFESKTGIVETLTTGKKSLYTYK